MGPESTIPYYHDIVYGVRERLGRDEFPPLAVESVDVFRVLGLCGAGKYDELTEYLLRAIESLAGAGADFAALSANTPHIVFDRLQARSPLPLVSIVEAARDEARRRKLGRLGLLGTVFTMEGEFFKAPFAAAGIGIVTPPAPERAYIGKKIGEELELGIVREDTRRRFVEIIGDMRDRDGIEAVVLGCTELPLLLNDGGSPVPCLDTMAIHVKALVERIVAE